MSAIDQILTGFGWQTGDLERARAELAQLRAKVERLDADNRALISEYKTLEDRFAEKARQLAEAREIILAHRGYTIDGTHMKKRDTWLAANPAPQEEPHP